MTRLQDPKRAKHHSSKDPSRTIMLRRQFLADMGARMMRIRRAVFALVAEEDAFGLRGGGVLQGLTANERALVVNKRWEFLSDTAKVEQFQGWLKQLVETELLSSNNPAAPWTDKYIASAYKQGLLNGYTNGKPGLRGRTGPDGQPYNQFLQSSFGSPESVKKLELLGLRTFTNLKGITATMDQQLSNVLVQGMAEGKAPGAIAKMMVDQIDGITKQRANTIARTEVIHAHAEGQLDGFQQAGLMEVVVMAEWSTSEDAKVCSRCAPMLGVIFTIEEARGLIPRHPNCRCAWLPAAVGEESTGQAWAHRQSKILESVKAETGLEDGAAARAASRWLGADKKLPSSITQLKPKQSALKEMKAAEKAAKTKAGKLAKATAEAEKVAKAKATEATKIKVGITKAKLAEAGVDLAEGDLDAAGNMTAKLASKILTGPDGVQLYSPEELILLVQHANGKDGPAQQVGYLLRQRQTALDAAKAAAKAEARAKAQAAAAAAEKAQQQAAKQAMQNLAGLGEADFAPNGLIAPKGLTTLADTLDLNQSQMSLLTAAPTASEQAVVLGQVKAEADAALDAVLLKYTTDYGLKPGTFFDEVLEESDWIKARAAMRKAILDTDSELGQAYVDHSLSTAGAAIKQIDAIPHLGKKLKAYEAHLLEFKAGYLQEQAQKAALARGLELSGIDAKIAKAGGSKTYKQAKASVLAKKLNKDGELITIATKQAKATMADLTEAKEEFAKAAGAAVKAKKTSLTQIMQNVSIDEFVDPRNGYNVGTLLEAVKGADWGDSVVTVLRYKGHNLISGGGEAVQAAYHAGAKTVKTVSYFDVDKWLERQAAKQADNLLGAAGFTVPKANIEAAIAAGSDDFIPTLLQVVPDSDPLQDKWGELITKANNAKIKHDRMLLDPAELKVLYTKADKQGLLSALAKLEDAVAGDFAGAGDYYTSIRVAKWQGQYIVKNNADLAEVAVLAKTGPIKVMVQDWDAAFGTVAAAPKPAASTAGKTALELLGGAPEVGTGKTPTLGAFMEWVGTDGLPYINDVTTDSYKIAPTAKFKAWLVQNAPGGAPAAPKWVDKHLNTMLAHAGDWPGQWQIIETALKTGVVSNKNASAAIMALDEVVPLKGLIGAENTLTKPGLKKLAKALNLTAQEVEIIQHQGFLGNQLAKAVSMRPSLTAKADQWTLKWASNQPANAGSKAAWHKAVYEENAEFLKKWGLTPATAAELDIEKFSRKIKSAAGGDENFGAYSFWKTSGGKPPAVESLKAFEKWAEQYPQHIQGGKLQFAQAPAAVTKVADIADDMLTLADDAPIPKFGDIKVLKNLPGSTKPQLVEDTTTGAKWVMKAGLDPGHVRSETLADDLYRRAGFAVPRSAIVDTSGGPVKFSEFLDGGKTLSEWLQTATPQDRAEMFAQIRKGFVMDALLANHDVAGLSYDNIFIVAKTAYRIDNGGALLYRAQGAAKRDFKAEVKELKSLRDKSVNSVTADIFSGLSETEIHQQIRDVLAVRDELLAAVPDLSLRKVLGERMDYLKGLLPTDTSRVDRALHLSATKHPAIYDIDEKVATRIKRARGNGVTLAGDKDMVEDNNLLVWEEIGPQGKPVTRVALKVNHKGGQAIGNSLPSVTTTSTSGGPPRHPADQYFTSFLSAAKTVGKHAGDGQYNQGTLQIYESTKQALNAALASNPDAGTKLMLQHYKKFADDIDAALAAKKPVGRVWEQYELPKQAAGKTPADTFRVQRVDKVGERVAKIEKGYIRAETKQQEFSVGYGGDKAVAYKIDADNGVTMTYSPSAATHADATAFHGRLVATIDGPVTPEAIEKFRATMAALGVDVGAPTTTAEEALYIHKVVYLRGKHQTAEYAAIWAKPDSPEKVAEMKAWVRKHMSFANIPDKPNATYNPAGTLSSFGEGHRVWHRWDLGSEANAEAELKGYQLVHYTKGLYESPPGAVGPLVEALLESGGELTSTMSRLRKGVSIAATGGDTPEADMGSGGADYIFTRFIPKGAPDRGKRGLFFKNRNALRTDAIHYDGDNFGNTGRIDRRAKTIGESKDYAKNRSNEMMFKHGISIIDEIDEIGVGSAAEKAQVVAAYKKAGLAVLPDGRKIETIVHVR